MATGIELIKKYGKVLVGVFRDGSCDLRFLIQIFGKQTNITKDRKLSKTHQKSNQNSCSSFLLRYHSSKYSSGTVIHIINHINHMTQWLQNRRKLTWPLNYDTLETKRNCLYSYNHIRIKVYNSIIVDPFVFKLDDGSWENVTSRWRSFAKTIIWPTSNYVIVTSHWFWTLDGASTRIRP